MGSVEAIERRMVQDDATKARIELESDGYSKHRDEINFFKAIEDGCIPWTILNSYQFYYLQC